MNSSIGGKETIKVDVREIAASPPRPRVRPEPVRVVG
jgi:hypothetical protein